LRDGRAVCNVGGVLGDQPVDVVTEYAATVTIQHLPEKP
jgi:hypothetical protein